MSHFLRFATEPRSAAYIFAGAMFIIYGLSPLLINEFVDPNPYMLRSG